MQRVRAVAVCARPAGFCDVAGRVSRSTASAPGPGPCSSGTGSGICGVGVVGVTEDRDRAVGAVGVRTTTITTIADRDVVIRSRRDVVIGQLREGPAATTALPDRGVAAAASTTAAPQLDSYDSNSGRNCPRIVTSCRVGIASQLNVPLPVPF